MGRNFSYARHDGDGVTGERWVTEFASQVEVHPFVAKEVGREELISIAREESARAIRNARYAAKGRWSGDPVWLLPMTARQARGYITVVQNWYRLFEVNEVEHDVPWWDTFVDVPIERVKLTPAGEWYEKVLVGLKQFCGKVEELHKIRKEMDRKNKRIVNQLRMYAGLECSIVLDDVVEKSA